MQTSATDPGRRRPTSAGFTLLELLVVLTILGLASAAVVLSVPAGHSLREDAERLAARGRAAHEKAVLDNRSVALRLSAEGYGLEQRREEGWKSLEAPFSAQRWQESTDVEGPQRIVFDPTGAGEAAEIVLVRGGARMTVSFPGNGGVLVRRPS